MMIIGLTGSIGMGKSTVAAMFRRLGVPVFDADAAVHQLQGAHGALLPAIEARFPGTTGAAGVDRQKLGAAVFGSPAELAALEAIVHPKVAAMRAQFLRRHRSKPVAVLDLPLLFEKPGIARVDFIVVVSAPAYKQRCRVLARKGMTRAKFKQIKGLQTPDCIKRRRADAVIDTGGLVLKTQESVRHLVACIAAKKGG